MLDHRLVMQLRRRARLILLTGRYEGVDERLRRQVDMEVSIGDYVLSGGELGAMVLIDAVVRQLPGVLNDASAIRLSTVCWIARITRGRKCYEESTGAGCCCPATMHKINRWRLKQALGRTCNCGAPSCWRNVS